MVQETKKCKEEIYEVNNKKYKVITSCIENNQNIEKLYEVLCRYAMQKLS